MFFLLYKHADDGVFGDFPKISDHFPKISKDFPKLFRRADKRSRTFSEKFQKFPKFSEDYLALSTELTMYISHRKVIRKLTFRALALRRSESRNCGLCVVYIQREELRFWLVPGNVKTTE